jgi:hypothetical protein
MSQSTNKDDYSSEHTLNKKKSVSFNFPENFSSPSTNSTKESFDVLSKINDNPEMENKNCSDDTIFCLNSLANKKTDTSVGYRKDVKQSATPDNITTNSSNYDKKFTNDKNKIPFWSEDPNIILNQKYISEFFPTENMTYEQKLNAITRLIVILTTIGFLFTQSARLLVISLITVFSIFMLYRYHTEQIAKRNNMKKENFSSYSNFSSTLRTDKLAEDVLNINNESKPSFDTVFDKPSENNPFSNVLITDYDYNPNKKPAGPSYTDEVNAEIINKTKEMITNMNYPDISEKLFKDLGDEFYFEQSMRPFYSNPNTVIPNDQTSFADFCYGGMISCKEGNMLACARNLARYQY